MTRGGVGPPLLQSRQAMTRDQWLSYYGDCGAYLGSLHAQLLAVLTLQGVVAIGALAAMVAGEGAAVIGMAGAALEAVFIVVAWKLFVQCGEVCNLMSEIELKHIGIPSGVALKTVLRRKPLFTSKTMQGVVLVAGTLFALALAVGGMIIGDKASAP